MTDTIYKITGLSDVFMDTLIYDFYDGKVSPSVFLWAVKKNYRLDKSAIAKLSDYLYSVAPPPQAVPENPPLLSVIIPTYNRKKMLGEAMEGVLRQDYPNIEIIIVDDCSTDGTEEYVRERYSHLPNLTYVKNDRNRNSGYSRKRGLALSKGEYLAFVDDDDYYVEENYFTRAVSKHLQIGTLAFVCAHSFFLYHEKQKVVQKAMNFTGYMDHAKYMDDFCITLMKPMTFVAVFSKENLLKCNAQNMEMFNDTCIFLRSITTGDVYCFDQYVGACRTHGENISNNVPPDFIIENLKEKTVLYNELRAKSPGKDINYWFIRQFMVTADYYINGSNPRLKHILRLATWCIKNCGDLRFALAGRVVKRYIKRKTRRY